MAALGVLVLLLLPGEALAYVPHDYSALYTHQLGNVFYLLACIAFLWTILRNHLRTEPGWRYIFWAVVVFLLWDTMVFSSRVIESLVSDGMVPAAAGEGGSFYFSRSVTVSGWGYLAYAGRFDFIALDAAMFLYYLGLREHLAHLRENANEIRLPAVLPLFPILATEIAGSLVFLVLAVLCIRTSIQLFRAERENILWSYLVWLSSAFLLFAVSRSCGHIARHLLLAAGFDTVWVYFEGISGSLNTSVRFVVATLTLFFVWIYQTYLKMSDDKRRIEAVSADIMNLNHEMEELGAERTFALLGLRIADNIRNPVSIIGCISQRMIRRGELSARHRENLEDVVAACRKLENIVSDFESIVKNRPHMFRYEDINTVVLDIADVMRPEAEQRHIQLITECSERPAMINLQRNLMRVGLFYLLRNAMNATSAGGTVSISTAASDEVVTVRISDTGCGIPKDVLARLFDPLYSQSGDRLRMALPLVRQIVSEHLGELVVNSEEGKGTTFDLIFPVKWCLVSDRMGK